MKQTRTEAVVKLLLAFLGGFVAGFAPVFGQTKLSAAILAGIASSIVSGRAYLSRTWGQADPPADPTTQTVTVPVAAGQEAVVEQADTKSAAAQSTTLGTTDSTLRP